MRTGQDGDRGAGTAPATAAGALRAPRVLRACLFLLALWLPFLEMNLHFLPATDIVEKRKLSPAPVFHWRNPLGFLLQYESFYDDHFGLRDLLVRWDGILRLKVLRASPVSRLIFGRGGWIFYDSEMVPDGVTIRDYQGLATYTPGELRRIGENLSARGRWCRARGIPCYIVVVPNKETMYPEYLPPRVRKIGPQTRLDQVRALVGPESGLTLIDLRPALRAAKAACPEPLYFRGGTHWNSYGAYYGYREIMRVLSQRYPGLRAQDLDDFEVTAVPNSSEDQWLGLNDGVSYRFRLRPSAARAPADTGPGKIVVVWDSFWGNLEPFMALHFPDMVLQRLAMRGDSSLPLVERERPAFVLYEVSERYGDFLWNP